MSLWSRGFLSAAAVGMLSVTSAAAQEAGAKALDGAYRGMIVCEKAPRSPDVLHVPLDMIVRGTNVQFARPLLNWNGERVIGSELGAGTIEADGKAHLNSTWHFGNTTFAGDYSGTLSARGGTLSGRQTWRSSQGPNGGRMCNVALVPAPKSQTAEAGAQ